MSTLGQQPTRPRRFAQRVSATLLHHTGLNMIVRDPDVAPQERVRERLRDVRKALVCAFNFTGLRTITRETIRAATTNSCSDRHLRSTRTPTLSGRSVSADFSASTTERPHEGAADYLHLTGCARDTAVTQALIGC